MSFVFVLVSIQTVETWKVKIFSIFKKLKRTLEPEGTEKLLSERSQAQQKRKSNRPLSK